MTRIRSDLTQVLASGADVHADLPEQALSGSGVGPHGPARASAEG